MQSVKAVTLTEFTTGRAKPATPVDFPNVGKTDADIFGNNLLQVMQFVFNHTTFDPDNELDQAVLAAYRPFGIAPGQPWDPAKADLIDGKRIRAAVEKLTPQQLALAVDPEFASQIGSELFKRKGKTSLEALLFQSVIGPIGMPAKEAMYPSIATTDGKPMNCMHDYVIRMSKDQLPPAKAFWSFTLYDTANGFFIPNDRKKYSVGENAGMKLDPDGGIAIYVAAEKPEGVPVENWLPIKRGDEDIDLILRIYVPDLEAVKTWEAPKAQRIQ